MVWEAKMILWVYIFVAYLLLSLSYIAKIHFMDTETFVAANFGELTTKHINFGDKLWQI